MICYFYAVILAVEAKICYCAGELMKHVANSPRDPAASPADPSLGSWNSSSRCMREQAERVGTRRGLG